MMTTVASVRTVPVLSADNLRCHRNHHGGRRRRCCCCSVVVAAKLFIQGRCPRQDAHPRTVPPPRYSSNNTALATGALSRPIISPRYSSKNKALSPHSMVFIQERCRARGHSSNDRRSVAHPGAMLLSRYPCNNRALTNVLIQYAIAYDKVFARICSQLLGQQIVSSTIAIHSYDIHPITMPFKK